MKHVAGIDMSTTTTGVMRIRTDGTGKPDCKLTKVSSSPGGTRADDGTRIISLLDRRNRLQSIAARTVRAAIDGYDPDTDDAPLFVIEAPLYRAPMRRDPKTGKMVPIAGGGHAHDRAWAWGLTVHMLFKHGFVVEVSTTTMKSYASGKGSGRKLGVLAAMPFMFPGLIIDDDNLADAAALAAMGARQLGVPVEPSPQRINPAALVAVSWPSHTQLAP